MGGGYKLESAAGLSKC